MSKYVAAVASRPVMAGPSRPPGGAGPVGPPGVGAGVFAVWGLGRRPQPVGGSAPRGVGVAAADGGEVHPWNLVLLQEGEVGAVRRPPVNLERVGPAARMRCQ